MIEPKLSPETHIALQTWPQDFPQELVNPALATRKQAFGRLSENASRETIPILVALLKHEKDPDLYNLAQALLLQLSDPAKTNSHRDPYGIFRI